MLHRLATPPRLAPTPESLFRTVTNPSFNKYVAIASKTTRDALKADLRVKAEKRGQSEARVIKISKGVQEEPVTLQK